MLTYVEHIDSELKKSGSTAANEAYQQMAKGKKGQLDNNEEGKEGEDELDQIGGGKEAEIEQYSQMLHKITEESIIQSGMLGKFLPPLVKIASHAVHKYSNAQ